MPIMIRFDALPEEGLQVLDDLQYCPLGGSGRLLT
jgi:hypothetical protein